MDPPVEHVVDVLRGAAAIHLGDVALSIVGVGVEAVVGHIAGRVVSVTAGRDVVVGRVNRWIETIPSLQGRLRHTVAIAIVAVGVILLRARSHGARGQAIEAV